MAACILLIIANWGQTIGLKIHLSLASAGNGPFFGWTSHQGNNTRHVLALGKVAQLDKNVHR
jgi:hypothetical protein